ncbi:MAG: dihydropteroate synthase [Proteobacteria bacterium]|nr:dihydropteroate synthase [Pseudomonadota bacterium]
MAARNLTTVLKSSKKEVEICRDKGVTIIGERINPSGRKGLETELAAGKFDILRRDAKAQLAAGAAILDVNAGVPGADEPSLLVQMIKEVRATTDETIICIDSANIKALDAALSFYCKNAEKPLVNSVNAQSSSLKELLPLIKQYEVAVVGLCSGDDGIPNSAEGRIRNAEKIIEEGEKLGISREDIIIDPIVLTLGAEWDAAKMVLDAIAIIVDKFGVNITIGASNVSFGLPDRESLTSYFLAMSVLAGLSCPICNPLKKQDMIALKAADLIMARDPYAMKWIEDFRARQGG